VAALFVLIFTGALTTFGRVPLRSVGDVAYFGVFIFNMLCFVQLSLVMGASLILSAGGVAQEKDRRTLIILLMTDLRAAELVIGKTLASLLPVFVLILVSFPVFCFLQMLGGITMSQILWIEGICLACALAAGSWGTMVGYWREKTFQILAITFMGAGLFIGLMEVISELVGRRTFAGQVFQSFNPFRAMHEILNPLSLQLELGVPTISALMPMCVMGALAVILWVYTCRKVRIWNPSRILHVQAPEPSVESDADTSLETADGMTRQSAREVWNWPIIWREICTQAYGRKVGMIKVAYFVFAVCCILWHRQAPVDAPLILGMVDASGFIMVVLSLIGLLLVNAQAVTSLTSERDGQTLELLLATEVTAKEFIFGKLGGILFNTKEVIAVPILFALSNRFQGHLGMESFVFTELGFVTLVCFSAMLGLHIGLSYEESRVAILNSLGTMFFLFVGVFTCMMLIVEARTSFALQLPAFMIFICGGSLGLWISLTHKIPSQALLLCSWLLPFMTFYAITSYLIPDSLAAFCAIFVTYGFTTIAMLVPAVSAFDVAFGRATIDKT